MKNADVNVPSGVCPLDQNVKIPVSNLPFNIYSGNYQERLSLQGSTNDLFI